MNFFANRIQSHQENDFSSKVVVAVSAVVLFFITMIFSSNFGVRLANPDNYNFFNNPNTYIALMLTIIFGAALAIFLFQPKVNFNSFLFVIMMIAGLMAARGMLLNFLSGDYQSHLRHWMEGIREHSGFDALRGYRLHPDEYGNPVRIGNYNQPYMYLLWILARFNLPDVALIKLSSIAFDVVLAYFVMKIVGLKSESVYLKILAFVGVLAVPTVLFNSALWAQSDSIYAAFAIGAIYFGLKKSSILSLTFFALAFGFKMQAVFILPIIIIFIMKDHIKLKHLWVPVVTFVVSLVPSWLAGMGFVRSLEVYFYQFGYYNRMNMNAINIWTLGGLIDRVADRGGMYALREHLITAAIFMAGAAMVAFIFFLYQKRDAIKTNLQWVQIAWLSVVIIPFILPKMHDRYLFMADVLAVVLFIYCKKFWYVPLITIFASFTTYTRFLFWREAAFMVDGDWWGSFSLQIMSTALLIAIILVLKDLVQNLLNDKQNKSQEAENDSASPEIPDFVKFNVMDVQS